MDKTHSVCEGILKKDCIFFRFGIIEALLVSSGVLENLRLTLINRDRLWYVVNKIYTNTYIQIYFNNSTVYDIFSFLSANDFFYIMKSEIRKHKKSIRQK